MWRGEGLYGLGVQGFEVLFLPFVFFSASVAPAGKYSVWIAEGFQSMFGVSGQQAVASVQRLLAGGCGWQQQGRGCSPLVLSVYHGVEKASMG
jgi:hypothetical protein